MQYNTKRWCLWILSQLIVVLTMVLGFGMAMTWAVNIFTSLTVIFVIVASAMLLFKGMRDRMRIEGKFVSNYITVPLDLFIIFFLVGAGQYVLSALWMFQMCVEEAIFLTEI